MSKIAPLDLTFDELALLGRLLKNQQAKYSAAGKAARRKKCLAHSERFLGLHDRCEEIVLKIEDAYQIAGVPIRFDSEEKIDRQ